MGVFWEKIPDSLIKWCMEQKMFWVASAPLTGNGHVNVSPKGGPYFGIPDSTTFWYMDLTGSGNETIAHLHEPGNGRITIMFNAFDGPPKIIRFWGKGRSLERGTPAFDEIVRRENIQLLPGTRSIIVVDIHQVGSSCGFSVPFFDFKEFRLTLNEFFEKKADKFEKGNEKEGMDRYWAYKNAWSIDGLPGMQRGMQAAQKFDVKPMKKMVGPLAPTFGNYKHPHRGFSIGGGTLRGEHILIAILLLLVVVLTATNPAITSGSGELGDLLRTQLPQVKSAILSAPTFIRR